MNIEIVGEAVSWWPSVIAAIGTVLAAIVIGIGGGIVSSRFSRARDQQDRESQWRQHAIELTKLELERKKLAHDPANKATLRPSILDFLANYRDLQELGETTPKDLYQKILAERIKGRDSGQPS